jgi:hypothetical protein
MRRLAVAAMIVAAIALAAFVAVGGYSRLRAEPPIRAPQGTFVPDGPKRRAILWAVGDGANGGRAAKGVAARMRLARNDRLLYLGDVYGSGIARRLLGDGTSADYRTRWQPVYGRIAARVAPTPGNHEWPQRGDGYEPYWRKVTGRTPPAYYEFRAGGWQLLSLNSQAPHDSGSAQVRWLESRTRAPGTCRLAFWHRPRYSAGRHGDQVDVAPLWNALRGRAALVIAGHDHNMQRLRPVAGIASYVSGAGGHGRYELRSDPRLLFGNDTTYGALRIDLRPGRARLTFVSADDGRVLDASLVRCHHGQAPTA